MNIRKAEKLKENGISVPMDLWPFVEGYIERREHDTERMRNFLSMSDYRSIDTLAHKIRGNGESYGFNAFAVFASEIQQAVQTQNRDQVKQSLEKLDHEIQKVKSLIL